MVQGGRLGVEGEEIGWVVQQHASSLDRRPEADVELHHHVRRTSCPRVARQSARVQEGRYEASALVGDEGQGVRCLLGYNERF